MEEVSINDIPGPQCGRRRRFTLEEKRRFLVEASAPGESMSSVGRRYGLSVSLLFRWRRTIEGGAEARPKPESDSSQSELRHLRERIRELERLLGKKTMENELLRESAEGLRDSGGVRRGRDQNTGDIEDGAPGTIMSSSREGTV